MFVGCYNEMPGSELIAKRAVTRECIIIFV